MWRVRSSECGVGVARLGGERVVVARLGETQRFELNPFLVSVCNARRSSLFCLFRCDCDLLGAAVLRILGFQSFWLHAACGGALFFVSPVQELPV